MVASPEPLVRLVGQRIGREGADPVPLLEVLSRRYYGNRALSDIRASRWRAARSSSPTTDRAGKAAS